MAVNFLQLNQDNTEVLIIGPADKREIISPKLQSFNPFHYGRCSFILWAGFYSTY